MVVSPVELYRSVQLEPICHPVEKRSCILVCVEPDAPGFCCHSMPTKPDTCPNTG
ncbi:hypothetical protein K505DRAFT_326691 [Melanomma pulvis-pyrius CBS 109.77]|uniref:Uncharacterized protein n=1 Tax=Melanomma pulvis-pyrius CBS 109.77 TaxID=1314802 RepID=A0A6A6X5R1_9PLEO|nr:hypothetical protein K505DRAFT_326691 [Melanomma pulvis-pyrius CBS 109.77]